MPNTLDTLALEIGLAVSPLSDALQSPETAAQLLDRLGWALPPGVAEIGLVGAPIEAVIEKLGIVLNSTPAEWDDELLMATRIGELAIAVAALIDRIVQIANNLPATLAGAGDYVTRTRIDQELLPRLLDLLLVNYVAQRAPTALALLRVITIIELRPVAADPTNYVTEHVRSIIHYDRIGTLFTDPAQLFTTGYGWGTATFAAEQLLTNVGLLLSTLGGSVQLRPLSRKVEEALLGRPAPEADTDPAARLIVNLLSESGTFGGAEVGLAMYEARATSAGATDAGLGLMPILRGTADVSIPLFSDALFLDLEAGADLGNGINLILRPGQPPVLQVNLFNGGGSTASARMGAGLRYGADDAEPRKIVTFPGGSYIELKKFAFMGGAEKQPGGAGFDAFGEIDLAGLRLVLTLAGADGFMQSVASAVGELAVGFDATIGWSQAQGIYFRGSSALELRLPVHFDLGPLKIESIYLMLRVGADGGAPEIPIEISVAMGLQLGPMAGVADRLGLLATLSFPESGDGNLGPVQLDLDFKPPTAIGLSLDAGVFKGGGFLMFDPDEESYAGILNLEFAEIVAVTAIGLITTRLPGGEQGFSLLIIISAEFTPIQLGLGFTLNGVGGLLGLNRSMNVDRLREGIRGSTLNSIMFPVDPIANALRIISDIREVFPAQADQFVFGPFVRIGWGTPTLITIDLGLLIEIPDPVRIAIIGVLKMVLPTEDAAILSIQVNFLGVIDFERGELSFDASLFNSRLLTMTLEGDMAVRLNWGDNPNFILSVGGFHPLFTPPEGLANMRRLTLSLLPGNNPRLTLEAYFAVTSNTVQFGARLELYVDAGPFNVYGFLGLDALFQFNPFYFIVQIEAGIAVRSGSDVILGIHVRLTLSGPTPWNARGTGEFEILFFSFEVDFNVTWGEEESTTLPDVDAMPLLLEALGKLGNWQAHTPAERHLLVTTKDLSGITDAVLVHPFGTLTISQKVVPLGISITKLGAQKITGADKFTITQVTSGTGTATTPLTTNEVRDQFAPAQFREMSDDEKLKSASFQQMPAGVATGVSNDLLMSKVTTRDVQYEETIIDRRGLRIVWRLTAMRLFEFTTLLMGNATAASPLSQSKKKDSPLATPKVSVTQEEYALVGMDDMRMVSGTSAFASQEEALSAMRDMAATGNGAADSVQVVPMYEVRQ